MDDHMPKPTDMISVASARNSLPVKTDSYLTRPPLLACLLVGKEWLMIFDRKMLAALALIFLLGLFAFPSPGAAQNRGQYLPGTNGLNSGVMPDPGLTYSNLFTWWSADTLKGPQGQDVATSGSANLYVDQNLVMYTTKRTFFGAHFMSVWDFTLANGSLTAPIFEQAGVKVGGEGVGDMYFQPATLGWHLNRADILVGYGFFAPTGRYVPGSTTNIGSGYWGNAPSAGITFYMTKNKRTQLSVYQIYEFHTQTRGSNVTPGQTYTMEWGFGQVLPLAKDMSKILQLGVIGYVQAQTTNDSGSTDPNVGDHYRVYAIGPQVTFIVPKRKFNVLFRYEPEFSAQKRAQGHTLVISAAYSF